MKKIMGVFFTAALIVGGMVTISPKPTFANLCNPDPYVKSDCPVGKPECKPAPKGMQQECPW
ncbi:hypothetical protein [Brevibacillus laterosporus]|uniref:hypothetical protein n=1 Tax=Brevibacillus laterosporus TaxID=1465 RepID=UPI00037EFC36|nr:hypothetical protein [Brevibacillus laterosporus]ATO50846.1 hypothetical protein BrL25_18165 [Brevibacillus laterosporus DSM 25]AYB38945.1 hypothetical protein D5F52_12070 [Brevibacillus laterosporus]MBG9804509.1 hypothetical protein [Brevibacillus laterosporus]MBM7108167.1 hypothetical protein [Brevibacillus laterosporus]MED2002982.1 hypothetical protein [Brevibacillus laterosporus]